MLTARGMESFGWANARRALCWARLKDAENAYQLIVNNLRPSTGGSNGTAFNLFDVYEVEMPLDSRPGHLELLPALPEAWAASGSSVTIRDFDR